jgi:hypothetical protein
MTLKEILIQELDNVPDPSISEVLNFLRFLKNKQSQADRALDSTSPDPSLVVPTESSSAVQSQYRYDDPFAAAIPLEDWDVIK